MSGRGDPGGLFSRNAPGMTERLGKSCVALAGLGGLGSNAAVALARAGVGRLILADRDRVELSNLNRQHYFQADIGRSKSDALAGHLRAINPDLDVTSHCVELRPDNVEALLGEADLLIEAFDQAEQKLWLIETWCRLFSTKPIVCGNGLSGCGRTGSLRVRRAGNIFFCGDGETDMEIGLCSARVAIVAAMQANVAIELLVKGFSDDQG